MDDSDPEVEPVIEEGLDVAVHPVTAAPFVAPGLKATDADVADRADALPIVEAAGAALGVVMEFDAADEFDVPTELEHVTVKV